MPIYAMRCDACGNEEDVICKIEEREHQQCSCGGEFWQDLSRGGGKFHPFRAGWYEHIAEKPIYVESMKQLKKECDKHGVTSKYVEDSR